jgi:hypothetical protein
MPPCNGRDYRVPQYTGPCFGCPYMTYQAPFINPPMVAPASPSRMEYMVIPFLDGWPQTNETEQRLNQLAQLGWRVVAGVEGNVVLERVADTVHSKGQDV